MRVDVRSLETYNRLAREGAERAASSLSGLTGAETFVNVTGVSIVPADELGVVHETASAVRVDFDGGLSGRVTLAFDRGGERSLTEDLLPRLFANRSRVDESAIREVGNIMTSGFIDGWADFLDTSIHLAPPTLVGGEEALPTTGADLVFVFESRLELVDESLDFHLYMLPDRESLERVLSLSDSTSDRAAVPLVNLETFAQMTGQGAASASENMSVLTGIDADVEVSRLRFVGVDALSSHVPDERQIGVILELEDPLPGYVAILFDESSANDIVDALIPTETDGFEGMAQSAIQEVGNIMTSGFIDGWANVLGSKIGMSTPTFVDDLGPCIMSPIAARLGRNQEFAFVVDASIRTGGDEFGCDVYVLPEEPAFTAAIDAIEVPDELQEASTPRSFGGLKENGV